MVKPEKPDDYIGAGVAFPVDLNVQGELKLSQGDPNIQESIRLILGTQVGERVYRPEFGSRLSDLVFAPLNRDTLIKLRLRVEEALSRWEPRITVTGIIAEADPIEGKVELTIQYRLRNSKDDYDVRNMIYPFYLDVSPR
ncbi:GPW/gp25 family protein [Sodalinema gerasimenkoae]|uniref:GPW/gp25 family protein n=1 Tax=Sodalinema gerasimenkoae TaxID=2862348 RepID=UPI001359A0EC|nr:GPW/gp25 family protein [Sodalinema gerasimenkoae]